MTAWSGWKSTFVSQEIYAAFLTVPVVYCDTLRCHFTGLSFYPGFYTKAITALPIPDFFVMCLNDNLCFTRCPCLWKQIVLSLLWFWWQSRAWKYGLPPPLRLVNDKKKRGNELFLLFGNTFSFFEPWLMMLVWLRVMNVYWSTDRILQPCAGRTLCVAPVKSFQPCRPLHCTRGLM